MIGLGEETGHEVVIVLPKRRKKEGGDDMEKNDCVEFLVRELEKAGLIVERFRGVPAEFLKVSCFISFI
jgi:anoctamin-10